MCVSIHLHNCNYHCDSFISLHSWINKVLSYLEPNFWTHFNAPTTHSGSLSALLLTLHDGHHPGADPWHHIARQPLFNSVDPHPANDGQEGQHCILGAFGIASGFSRRKKLFLTYSFIKTMIMIRQLQRTGLHSRQILFHMVQEGFALPGDFLMIFTEAVLRVHRSGHRILSPQSRHLMPQMSEESNPSAIWEDLEIDPYITFVRYFLVKGCESVYLICDQRSISCLCQFCLNTAQSLTQGDLWFVVFICRFISFSVLIQSGSNGYNGWEGFLKCWFWIGYFQCEMFIFFVYG